MRATATSSDGSDEQPAEALVTFHPQIWHEGRAVTSDDLERFSVPLEDATTDDGELLEDDTDASDRLRSHENAPERARHWQGPYYVTVKLLPSEG